MLFTALAPLAYQIKPDIYKGVLYVLKLSGVFLLPKTRVERSSRG